MTISRLEPVLNNLVHLIESSDREPHDLRMDMLCCLAEECGSRAAVLFLLPDEANDTIQKVSSWGERTERLEYELLIKTFIESQKEVDFVPAPPEWNNSPFLEVALLRLSVRNQLVGILLLGFVDRAAGPQVRSFLTWAGPLLALFEHNQKLILLLQRSQEHLQKLSRETGRLATKNSRLLQQLLSNQERLKGLSKGVIRVQEEERARISRELHDGVGQSLSALKINLDLIRSGLRGKLTPKLRERLEEAKQLTEQSLQDVRELSHLLRPRMLDDFGLPLTVRWYARTFSRRTGIQVSVEINEIREVRDPEVEILLFRVIQEALTNVAKHSFSKTARIRLSLQEDSVHLEVADKGIGFDPVTAREARAGRSGLGLAGIRDRVSLVGGSTSIKSMPQQGTRLEVQIPLPVPSCAGEGGG